MEKNERNSENVVVALESVQNIQNVAELHGKLVKTLEQNEKIEIDASELTSIDTASLQLLIVLKKTAVKAHKEVSFDFPSEKFIEAAELLGLSEMLELEQAGSAGLF